MFLGCYIKNVEVECATVFTSVMQEGGLCHTFHSTEYIKDHGPLTAERTGPPFGLRFVLNVEQDEYSSSPVSSAGFQVG